MKLNELSDRPGARKAKKRIGRGLGSGSGKTGGRGQKGQRSRAGTATRAFEGGQMPIYRRLPKRGFKNPGRADYAVVNLDRLQAAVDAGKIDPSTTIDAAVLVESGVVRRALDGVRLLARGELSQALALEVVGASKAAIAAVEKAGGSVVVTGKAPVPAGNEGESEQTGA